MPTLAELADCSVWKTKEHGKVYCNKHISEKYIIHPVSRYHLRSAVTIQSATVNKYA